ncbi:fluoride efflux transporter CrcB [Halorubellus sp. JP-L1]|uniref:fluoride efflux transporter CrcB n=1 Tax=Halorubellus sp. JP-L1 TaxID=2715753 RepID=UPI00140E84E7|nr:fluoride efflux transporter CrcB [Halorubellus sp. JP-L1]
MNPAVLVGIGGALGAVARHAVYERVDDADAAIPHATLAVNVLGSLVLGLATGLGASGVVGGDALLFVGTGACGAFTTFSTFAFETVDRAARSTRAAAANALGTLALALAGAALGFWLATLA